MAEGRFVSRSISANEQLADVSIEAALLFSWCIPHLDVDGRLKGSPMFLKSSIVPLRDEFTIKRIPAFLEELGQAVGREGSSLLVWYEASRQQVLFFPGFERQQKLRRDREGRSKLPALSEATRILVGMTPGLNPGALLDLLPEQVPELLPEKGSQVEVQGEVEVQVQKKNNLAVADATAPSANWVTRLTQHFQREVGHVTPGHLGKVLKPFVEREGIETIETAITYYALDRRTAGRAGKFTWFAEDIAQWIDNAKLPLQLEDGTFTPLGERLYGLNGARR
jgi:hypothetical protein